MDELTHHKLSEKHRDRVATYSRIGCSQLDHRRQQRTVSIKILARLTKQALGDELLSSCCLVSTRG